MALSAGTQLGPYEIVARIGAGGMSEVYRAIDPRIGRDVAIKVLPPAFAKFADRMHRFETEARAAGALNHPNLITIFDVGKAEGKPYIVTELLEGDTLRGHLREGGVAVRLPVRKAVDYGIQIANGLAAAHERGIVHRDLKPENLFVTKDGRVKILDFGVAKLRSADDMAFSDDETMEQDTSPGTVIGTVGYMSPEQVRGQGVDGRSDIFSLGTLLYEMVAGEHPFRSASPADTMSAILREDPPDLTTINSAVTPGLDRVIRHCLEKSPEQRFQSARDLAFDLDMISSGSGTMPVVTEKAPRRGLIAAAIGLALLLTGAAIGWILQPRVRKEPPVSFTHLTWNDGIELGGSLAPDGQTFVYTRDTDVYLQRVGGRNAINLTKNCAAADSQPAFSPDGTMIAYRSECDGGGIFVMGATGESSRRLADGCFNPSWSPDSARIVCATESVNYTPTSRGTMSALWVIDVRNGAKRKLLEHDGVQPSWSPHGNRIAYWGMAGESAQRDLWTIDPAAADPAKSVVRVNDDPAVDWNPVWSPDGRFLYYGSDRSGAMNLWRVPIDEKSGKTHGEAEPMMTPSRFSGHYSISRDGTRILFSSIEQTEDLKAIHFDPVAGATVGESRSILAGSFLVFSSQVSPDGRFIAVTNRGGQEDLSIVDVASGEMRQITNDAARDRAPVWSPDGQLIYFYSNRDKDRYEIWSVRPDGSGLTQITHTTGRSVWYPGIAPDGRRLAFFNDEHSFLMTGNRIEALPPSGEGLHPAMSTWSPDGTMLAGEVRDCPGLAVYTIATRTYRTLTQSGARPIWLPNGREILFSDGGKPRIVDVVSGAFRDVATTVPASAMSLSADGRTLVYSDRRTQSDIWMMTLGTATVRP